MNNEVFNELNQKYKNRIQSMFNNYVYDVFDIVEKIENFVYSNEIKMKLISNDKMTIKDVNFYFNTLFDANNTSEYDLTITKMVKMFERLLFSFDLVKGNNTIKTIDYEYIENRLVDDIKNNIQNLFNTNTIFEIELFKKAEEKAEQESIENQNQNNNDELIIKLANKCKSLLPTIIDVINIYGLYEIQDIDFSIKEYKALQDCFEKNKFSKTLVPNVNEIINKVNNLDTLDINDVLSEQYAEYVLTILEASYFAATNLIDIINLNNTKKIVYKNETALINRLKDEFEYYIDMLELKENYSFIDYYREIYRWFEVFDIKEYEARFINEYMGNKH